MRLIARRILLAAIAVTVVLALYMHRGQATAEAQGLAPVTATRIYTGADGLTHVEDVEHKIRGSRWSAGRPGTVRCGQSHERSCDAGRPRLR